MNILQRYVGRTIIATTLLLVLLLAGVEFFILLIRNLDEVGEGDFHLLDALLQVVYSLPYGLYKFFPMAAMLGSLLGLGQLASHSELIVMRTSGVSSLQLTWAVIKAALILVVIVTVVGEVVAPYTERAALTAKEVAISGGQTLKTVNGMWVRNDKQYIHIQQLRLGEKIQGITVYQFDDKHRLLTASYAKTASYEKNGWLLEQVQESHIALDGTITVEKAATKPLSLTIDPQLIGAYKVKQREMNLVELYNFVKFQTASGQASGEFELSFWQRIFQPVITCVMMFLAIPMIFGSLRTVAMGVRLLLGACIGFSFYLMDSLFGPISLVYQFPPVIAAILPSVVFFGIGLFLMRRVR